MPELNGIPLVPQEKQQAVSNPVEAVVSSELSLEQKRLAALREAVSAIYFNDRSDYLSFLWEIVGILGGGEMVATLKDDDFKAVNQCVQACIDNSC